MTTPRARMAEDALRTRFEAWVVERYGPNWAYIDDYTDAALWNAYRAAASEIGAVEREYLEASYAYDNYIGGHHTGEWKKAEESRLDDARVNSWQALRAARAPADPLKRALDLIDRADGDSQLLAQIRAHIAQAIEGRGK